MGAKAADAAEHRAHAKEDQISSPQNMLSFGRPTGLAVGLALKELRLPRVHRGISPWDLLGPPFRRFEFSGLGVAQYTQNTQKGRKSYVNMGFALASQRRTRADRADRAGSAA